MSLLNRKIEGLAPASLASESNPHGGHTDVTLPPPEPFRDPMMIGNHVLVSFVRNGRQTTAGKYVVAGMKSDRSLGQTAVTGGSAFPRPALA